MNVNLWMGYDDIASAAAVPTIDNDGNLVGGHPSFRALSHERTRDIYRKDEPPGPRIYELWSQYYAAIETVQQVRDIRNALLTDFPGQLRTIGAWWYDGRQVGTDFLFDEEGNIIGVSGQPAFPLHTSILKFMPDIIVRDKDGNVISTTPATVIIDVNLLQGQKKRRFQL